MSLSIDETLGATPPLDETLTDRAAPPAALLSPRDSVGRYVILSKLGSGGMGVVYAAFDPELDRKVALKMLLADPTNAGSRHTEGRSRLLREAQALAKFSHPEIVAVYDVGEHSAGVWLAMEFVDGRTLGAWAKDSPRTWPEILTVMLAAGRGVAAAHAAGLIHRDLKPDNIMVANDGRVRVMDFGLTRPHGEQPAFDLAQTRARSHQELFGSPLTQDGSLLGTPAYMAPEQFSGVDPVTAATDQFSFCVTLWELLYGQRPFEGRSLMELGAAVLSGEIRTPPRGRSVPGWLRRTCERGLSRPPAKRWPSMQSLLEELGRGRSRARTRNIAIGLAVIAGIAAGAEGYRRFDLAARTNACEAEGAAIQDVWNDDARVALRTALVGTNVSYAADTAERVMPWLDDQAHAWQAATTASCLDANVTETWDADMLDRSMWCLDERRMELEALITELSTGEALAVVRTVQAAAGLSRVDPCRDPELLARLPGPPVEHREGVRAVRAELSRAWALRATGDYPGAIEVARASLDRATEIGWPPLTATARLRVATLLGQTAAYEEAASMLKDAYFEAAEAGAPEVAADAAIALVFGVGFRLARHAEGMEWARHAELALASLPDPEGLREAARLSYLGNVHRLAGSYDRAKALNQEALGIKERSLGPTHPELATILSSIALAEEAMGEYLAATPLHERAVAITEAALGPTHPDVAGFLNNLAENHRLRGSYVEAKALFERALVIKEQGLGPDHPSVASSLTNLALVEEAMGAFTDATPLHERALAIKEKVLGLEHPEVATILNNLAENLRLRGELAEALAMHGRALAIKEKALGPNHTSVAVSLTNTAVVHHTMGSLAAAREFHERALKVFEEQLGATHPNLSYPLVGLAEIAVEEGRSADALPLAERALSLRQKGGSPPAEIAEAEFIVAQATWDSGGSRSDAVAAAELARDVFRTAKADEALAEAEAWLGAHPLDAG